MQPIFGAIGVLTLVVSLTALTIIAAQLTALFIATFGLPIVGAGAALGVLMSTYGHIRALGRRLQSRQPGAVNRFGPRTVRSCSTGARTS